MPLFHQSTRLHCSSCSTYLVSWLGTVKAHDPLGSLRRSIQFQTSWLKHRQNLTYVMHTYVMTYDQRQSRGPLTFFANSKHFRSAVVFVLKAAKVVLTDKRTGSARNDRLLKEREAVYFGHSCRQKPQRWLSPNSFPVKGVACRDDTIGAGFFLIDAKS